jgi:metallo-beta-lactamase family protein
MAKATFVGAWGTVTGSATLLEFGDRRLLVDCGLFQGGYELERRNRAAFPFAPYQLDAVLLTHAHLDHTGLVPRLCAEGYSGPIFCAKPSRALISLLLEDAGAIQEEEARYARKRGYGRHADPTPLYTRQDAKTALRQLQAVTFDHEHDILPGIRARYRRAGHLLGAGSIEISAKGADGERRSWCFSGDIGRYGAPILQDPQPPLAPPAVVVLESTYGDRRHAHSDPLADLAAVLLPTLAQGGVAIVPAFALGRTQEVLYHLSALVNDGRLDPDAVVIDSPMAIAATELYQRAASEHDDEMVALLRRQLDPLAYDRFQRARSAEESKALNHRAGPLVIVAASGMAEGGRVVHHLLHRLADPENAVIFVGYQAAGTRGRALVEGVDTVAIHGTRVPVRAAIRMVSSLSAHADQQELLRWAAALPAPPARVFLNHGEDPARKALAAALTEMGWPQPALPVSGDQAPW